MIEKIKAFFRKVSAVVKAAVQDNKARICLGAGLALFGSGWHPAFGFIGGALGGIFVIDVAEPFDARPGEIDLPGDLAVVIGAGLGTVIGAVIRLALGGA